MGKKVSGGGPHLQGTSDAANESQTMEIRKGAAKPFDWNGNGGKPDTLTALPLPEGRGSAIVGDALADAIRSDLAASMETMMDNANPGEQYALELLFEWIPQIVNAAVECRDGEEPIAVMIGKIAKLMGQLVDRIERGKIESRYIPMLHGKVTDALACMNSRGATVNPITGSLVIERKDVKLVIQKVNEMAGILGINAHKLLCSGIAAFTANNNVSGGLQENLKYGVTISVREFALQCGHDVETHIAEDATEEERALEKKRISNILKDVKRKVRRYLQLLSNSRISWSEKVRGRNEDYMDMAIIGTHSIRKDYIYMMFDPFFAQYLVRLPLTQYSKALMMIDPRSANAYCMGLKMDVHFNMYNNQIRETAQLLKVKTLLRETSLPTIDAIRKQRTSWEARIKEPFENSLGVLVLRGVLENWEYSRPKGEPIADEEFRGFSSYEEWEDMLVYFTLKDAPEQREKLEARAGGKEAGQAGRRNARKKKSGGRA